MKKCILIFILAFTLVTSKSGSGEETRGFDPNTSDDWFDPPFTMQDIVGEPDPGCFSWLFKKLVLLLSDPNDIMAAGENPYWDDEYPSSIEALGELLGSSKED